MRVVLSKQPLERVARIVQRLLFVCAVALLGYCAFALLDAWNFQRRLEFGLARRAQEQRATSVSPLPIRPSDAPEESPPAAGDGPVGRLDIKRVGLSVMVAEGVDSRTLRRAAGHIPGTALPGQVGNVGVAGHRDTFFRPLEGIRVDDVIVFTTPAAQYRYRVVSSRIVEPVDVSVLDPGEGEMLTLVTCYPFYFVGPAPNRFVVRAERL